MLVRHSNLQVYVHDDSDIVRMELPMPPAAVTYDKIATVKGWANIILYLTMNNHNFCIPIHLGIQ